MENAWKVSHEIATCARDDSRRFSFSQSLLKTADQLKIKGLCEVPESRDGPPSVSLSSPPRESGTPRLNYTKLKKHHPRYKRARTTFEPRATDPRHYERYKEEEVNQDYSRDNKEVTSLTCNGVTNLDSRK